MSWRPHPLTLLAGLALGSALWVSLGVVDRVEIGGEPVRIALLPPVWTWIAMAGAATLGLLGAERLRHRRSANTGRRGDDRWLLPPVVPAVLVVPYLPVLADRWPVLLVLGGPFRWVVWTAVLGQVAWVAWQEGWIGAAFLRSRSRVVHTLLVWLAVASAAGWAAARLTTTPQFPTGDEPHYLVIAQSLWRDGDLKIENNHAQGDYLEYYGQPLAPHYLTRGVDGEIYSIHPVGMPLLIAPVYAAGGYPLVVLCFVFIAATAATVAWRAHSAWLGSLSAATFGWAAVAGSAPFLVNTLTIYPEVPAALAVALAFTLPGRSAASPGLNALWRWGMAGIAIASLPWLSTKYAPMSAALVAVVVGRAWLRWDPQPLLAPAAGAWRAVLLVLVPYAVSLAGWFASFEHFWGAPWPSGPYGTLTQTTPLNLMFGAPGLLFDQEYGLLPYAPVLILAGPGLWAMIRRGGDQRRLAIETSLVFLALLGTVGAFRIWWGGTAVVGRPLVSGLLLLALPIAVQYATAAPGSARRAAQHLLLWVGLAVTATLVVAQNGLLLGNQRDGTSALLEWLSPWWEIWTLVPTFIAHEPPTAWLHSLLWLGVAGLAAAVVSRVRVGAAGTASFAALLVLAAGLTAAAAAMPLLPAAPVLPRADHAARASLAALDAYDTSRLPTAIVYDRFRIVQPAHLLASLTLEVRAGARTVPQPMRVIHNGRFSLPAGDYHLALRWADTFEEPTRLALQVGRTGPEWQEWTIAPVRGEHWTATFSLPVDGTFVGLHGSSELEDAIDHIAITPIRVVDARLRPVTPEVTAAGRIGHTSVFFHDGKTHTEPSGFWALGARRTDVSIVAPDSAAELRLRVHSGARPNRVALIAGGWRQTLALEPGVVEDVRVPVGPGGLLALTIDAEAGFVPAEVDPLSRDERLLGVWIEFAAEP